MSEHVYQKIEMVGSSKNSIDDAIQNAVKKAAQKFDNVRWFEVQEIRGQIDQNQVAYWQVTVKIGLTDK